MKRLIFVLLVLIVIGLVTATPPSQPEFLYAKSIDYSSDEFYFMAWEDSQLQRTEMHAGEKYMFPEHSLFNVSVEAERISITLDDRKVTDAELSSLKTKTNDLYMLPGNQLHDTFINTEFGEDRLSQYNNSKVKIYLDDTLVREYTMGHMTAHIKGGDPNIYFDKEPMNPYLIVVPIILIIVIYFIMKKRK